MPSAPRNRGGLTTHSIGAVISLNNLVDESSTCSWSGPHRQAQSLWAGESVRPPSAAMGRISWSHSQASGSSPAHGDRDRETPSRLSQGPAGKLKTSAWLRPPRGRFTMEIVGAWLRLTMANCTKSSPGQRHWTARHLLVSVRVQPGS